MQNSFKSDFQLHRYGLGSQNRGYAGIASNST